MIELNGIAEYSVPLLFLDLRLDEVQNLLAVSSSSEFWPETVLLRGGSQHSLHLAALSPQTGRGYQVKDKFPPTGNIERGYQFLVKNFSSESSQRTEAFSWKLSQPSTKLTRAGGAPVAGQSSQYWGKVTSLVCSSLERRVRATTQVFPSDIELYLSPDLIPWWLKRTSDLSLQRNREHFVFFDMRSTQERSTRWLRACNL